MLRTLRHPRNSPRMIGLKATSAGGACTVNIGTLDVHSAASASTGKAYLTLKEPFRQVPIVVGTPMQSVGAAGALLLDADHTEIILKLLTHDGTAADDGAFHALALGWDAEDLVAYRYGPQNAPFRVKSTWNSPRLELFKVTGHATTPVVNIGSRKATVSRNGAGDYTLTFTRPFAHDDVVAVVGVISASAAHAHIVSATATAVRFLIGASGSGSDSLVAYIVVKGSDSLAPAGLQRKVLQVSDRRPRVIAGHVAYSAGVPSIVHGTDQFTVSDTGTGVLTVTFTDAFLREPFVFVNKDTAGYCTLNAAAGVGSCVMNFFNGAGAAADPADVQFMIFGYDDADEYAL